MMLGTVPTSVPQLILFGNWLVEGAFIAKWKRIRSNKIFWALSLVFLTHALGLFYTSDMAEGIKDVRTKIPLLFLPLVFFSSKPFSLKEFHGLLFCFLIGSFFNTAWCLTYSFVLHHNVVGRSTSRFMSHIRLGLYLNMAITTCIYFAVRVPDKIKKSLAVAGAGYFILIMYVLGMASGIANLFILMAIAGCVLIFRQRAVIKLSAFILLCVVACFSINTVYQISKSQLELKATGNNQQLKQSLSGRAYAHFDTKGQKENGNYVLINIQLDELKNEWKKQFPDDSFNYEPNPHNIKRYEVLVRYLASKGLNKDSVGISNLSTNDKINIKKGICNYLYTDWGFMHKRIYELVCEYDDFINKRDINGHSLTMRFYFWDAAIRVIKKYPVVGVGTGDVQLALNQVYSSGDSPLNAEWYKRPHNQFLTVTVALGFVGLLAMLFSIIYPLVLLRKHLHILFWPFLILALVSFMLEDTLETQAGLSFYAVFNSLLISFAFFNKESINNSQNA